MGAGASERLDANKIKPVPGQEGQVRAKKNATEEEIDSVDTKARKMANKERPYRALAKSYEMYLRTDGMGVVPPEEIIQDWRGGRYEDVMKRLRELGASPEYIRRVGQLEAEVAGAQYDWENKLQTMTDEELATEEAGLEASLTKLLGVSELSHHSIWAHERRV